jgi:sulfite exporter TauE/SafE
MQTALVGTALLMGLAGGPHCVAMCGAACAGVIAFPAGRAASYALGGAIAASAVQSLALVSEQVAALRPAWLLMHIFVFAWGLVLAVWGRQPLWAHGLGRWLVRGLKPLAGSSWRVLATGAVWVGMPCGLLYSALMLAALGNGPLEGAAVMAAFAAGSAVSLLLAPWLWRHLRNGIGPVRREWGTRTAGALLAAVALQAVWHDLSRQIAIWCA